MKWIGLTGGIACGKSTVAQLLKENGIPVIDADQIARQVVGPGSPGLQAIVQAFGSAVVNDKGELNRPVLSEIVFASSEKLKILEQITHPLIQQEVQLQKEKFAALGYQAVVYDIPLLFETQSQKKFDKIIVVWCDLEVQLSRLMSRNNFSEAEARLRISKQLDMTTKKNGADYLINNSGSESELLPQVLEVIKKITK